MILVTCECETTVKQCQTPQTVSTSPIMLMSSSVIIYIDHLLMVWLNWHALKCTTAVQTIYVIVIIE